MSNMKAPAKGTELKLNININIPIGNYTMDDIDFSIEFYGNKGVVSVQKDKCIRVDESNYLAVVNTATTGCGVLDARVTAYIPDADCEDGLRTEVVFVKNIETVY